MTKRNEKDELMEKVFGKNAKRRTLTNDDLDILNAASESFNNDLSRLAKSSSIDIENLNKACDQIIDNTTNITNLNNKKLITITNNDELENLRQTIINDFGTSDNVLISYKQVELYEKFKTIEQELNKTILCQSDYLNTLCKAMRRVFVMGINNVGLNGAILISGQDYTGKHKSIKTICEQLEKEKLLNSCKCSNLDLNKYQSKEDETNFINDIYSALANAQVIIFDNLENIEPVYLGYLEEILTTGQLNLNKRYTSNNNQLAETGNALVKNSIDHLSFNNKYLVFVTTLKASKLLNVVGSRFINALSDILETRSFTSEDIALIYENKFNNLKTKCLTNLNIELSYDDELKQLATDKYDGSNCLYINEYMNDIYAGLSEYKLANPSDELININLNLKEGTIYFNENKLNDYLNKKTDKGLEDIQAELDKIVGLQSVKDYIYSLKDFYAAQQLKKAQGMPVNDISKHMIFTGNPGTGKTTIARLLSKYLKAIGVLSNGQLIEVSRADLVGKYVGHTAPLTMQVINSAKGGILFIDEAYSLYRGENDSFGLECIDTLVKAMEDNREDLIVILAGYTKEMKEFLESNSGLKSRFPNQIEFPDYTGEELYQIACINAKSSGYTIDQDCKDSLITYFNKKQIENASGNGNGRLARNVVEKAIIKQASRVLKDNGQLDLLIKQDFVL